MMRDVRLLDSFYPIVPDVAWLKRIAPLGIKTVQLRIKDESQGEISRQVREAIIVCRAHNVTLIVNDYWKIALDEGAAFIHLGQEDLAVADIDAIRKSNLRFGVSTHDDSELERALRVQPDYVALGPVYETKLKVMKWAPQGLDRIRAWKANIGHLPLVAIGGITPERAPEVIKAGADSVAVITDFVTHPDPEARIATWVSWSKKCKAETSANKRAIPPLDCDKGP